MVICDFCSGTPVVWDYPAKSFTVYDMPGVKGDSIGGWAACEPCGALIERDDRAGLVDRTLRSGLDSIGIDWHSDRVRGMIARLHERFFDNRLGPRQEAKP
jgi:hypothetical protein